jgi:hypothetical protein
LTHVYQKSPCILQSLNMYTVRQDGSIWYGN